MILSAAFVLAAPALCAAGAAAAFLAPARCTAAVLAISGGLAALAAMAGGALLLAAGGSFHIALWPLLSLGSLALRGDALSGFFLLVAGLVFLPVSIFSASRGVGAAERASRRYFALLHLALFASVVLVLVAGDAISFLSAWEAMSVASYLFVAFDRAREDGGPAAYVMLAMSEIGTIAAALALILIAVHAGTTDFAQIAAARPALGAALGWAAFLLSFFGFAVKAGLVPASSWLPLAYPPAPTGFAALSSAIIVNLGIYGILRVNLDLAPAAGAGPGLVVLAIGSVSALVGILYATIQAELKQLLAYSTIENMGLVAAGIGAAMIFLAEGHPVAGAIALVAAFYHLANHSLYKALLFIGVGAIEAGTQTRDLDRLGGILRRMPWTGAFFLVGVLSISALPPFNGFVSEWLILQTILRSALLASVAIKIVFAVAGALIALTAGLAATCFAKLFAMGFLGMPRSPEAAQAAEAGLGTRLPLAFLALLCFLFGVLPTYVIPVADQAVVPIAHASATAALVPPFFTPDLPGEALPPKFVAEFHDLGAQIGAGVLPGRGLVVLHRGAARNPVVFAMSTSYMLLGFAAILALSFGAFRLAARRRSVARGPVWDGGLRRLRPESTYTATGFSNPVRVIFRAILSPRTGEDSTEAVAQHFRTAIHRKDEVVSIVDRLVLEPPLRALRRLAVVRRMHLGRVNAYAAYVLLALLAVLILGTGLR